MLSVSSGVNFPKERKIFFAGGFCFFVAAIFSQGYFHPDEHFQILEYAGFKLGHYGTEGLPWEFQEKMRPAFQPFVVFVFARFFEFLGSRNPFVLTLFLRLLSAAGSLLAIQALLVTFGRDIKPRVLTQLIVPLSFLFWFQIYFGVRFSSENWGVILFVFGLFLVQTGTPDKLSRGIWAGALLGLSFLCRFQMAFMILGLVTWLLVQRRIPFRQMSWVILGFFASLLLGAFLDRWLYGEWCLSAWNYFHQNIITGKVAQFGESPWYFYFYKLFLVGIPPLSIYNLAVPLVFFVAHPSHVFTFILVPFLMIHQAIGHKEARFLFPVIYFLPVMTGYLLSDIPKFKVGVARIFFRFVWVLNFVLLLIVMFRPADTRIPVFRKVCDHWTPGRKLLYLGKNPYLMDQLPFRFYSPGDLPAEETTLENLFDKPPSSFLLISDHPLPSETVNGQTRLLFSNLPSWVLNYNIGHWADRTLLWWLYEVIP